MFSISQHRYVEKSQFIAEINNEPPYDNKEYAENMKKLDGLVLVKFTEVSGSKCKISLIS